MTVSSSVFKKQFLQGKVFLSIAGAAQIRLNSWRAHLKDDVRHHSVIEVCSIIVVFIEGPRRTSTEIPLNHLGLLSEMLPPTVQHLECSDMHVDETVR
jgi:hypothetical protein